jgi:exosortase/archaeosortase family protein
MLIESLNTINQKIKTHWLGPYGFVLEIGLFILITYGFHKTWWLLAPDLLNTKFIQMGSEALAKQVYLTTYWLNENVFGLNMKSESVNIMRFENNKALMVAETCSGLKQFFQVAVLFLLYPGPWRHKIWFIPLGFAAIHLTNIFRVLFLSLWMAYDVPNWNFAHDWIMRPMYYVVIFLLWYIWNESRRKLERNRENEVSGPIS